MCFRYAHQRGFAVFGPRSGSDSERLGRSIPRMSGTRHRSEKCGYGTQIAGRSSPLRACALARFAMSVPCAPSDVCAVRRPVSRVRAPRREGETTRIMSVWCWGFVRLVGRLARLEVRETGLAAYNLPHLCHRS